MKWSVRRDGVVAEGEATGHAHRVLSGATVLESTDGDVRLEPTSQEAIHVGHEEHGAVTLPAVAWTVGHVQIYDPIAEAYDDVRD